MAVVLIKIAWFEVESCFNCLHALSHQKAGYGPTMAETSWEARVVGFQNLAKVALGN